MIDVKDFREQRSLSVKQVVEVVKESAPAFDRYLLCKVENPEKYGVRLLDGIEQNLKDAFAQPKKPVKKDQRKKPCKLTFRLGKMKMRRLQQAAFSEGFETMQACLEHVVTSWLDERNVREP